jgi:hypothetical protein
MLSQPNASRILYALKERRFDEAPLEAAGSINNPVHRGEKKKLQKEGAVRQHR